ncbi:MULTISPECIES: signal peptidase II [Enterococcus]|uniref:Lipoprotein signal peptidase n=1 Tax=Enterococcus sulfureus ATCC 49903 TaxID=1140003 RepID=S0KSK3_9ENTE|nr:signal peptidase II [Enterococcus sulfureus]EOT47632.1 signal peptidase II [Enterococcus sulfureus ATCC 49903]EOT83947.1 signal peptidase II [Enterococcus sulfureus ATCC 49903]
MLIYLILALVVIVLDQLVKYQIVAHLALGESVTVIPHVLSFTYLQNTGAAWSLFEGKQTFFTIITIIAVVVVSYLLYRNRHGHWLFSLGLALILAGAIGNFIDRIRLGFVVDMFQTEFISFPIFNVADMALSIGVILIFIYTILEDRLKGTHYAK